MTLNGVLALILHHFTDYVKVVEDTPILLRQKCSPKHLVFSDISFVVIFAEVTENECIIHGHLSDIQ